MKIIVIPDSFKGTLTSFEVCETISGELGNHFPNAEIISVPIADGGEGTLDCMARFLDGKIETATACDPWQKPADASYLISGNTAVIEMARVAGFVASGSGAVPALHASTYGVGLLVADALKKVKPLPGIGRKIIIALGGSCTNDGGCGMAAALGTKFYRDGGTGEPFVPTGETLKDIVHVDNSETLKLLGYGESIHSNRNVDIVGMCDVKNPLCGPKGASHVFGPQKGASPADVELLESGMENLVSVISEESLIGMVTGHGIRSLGVRKLADLPGSGTAGGIGFGVRAFLDGRLESGIDIMLDSARFDSLLSGADLVITGEGRFDYQSLDGKVISGICERARQACVPVAVIAGTADVDELLLEKNKICKCIEAGPVDMSLDRDELKSLCISNLKAATAKLAGEIR